MSKQLALLFCILFTWSSYTQNEEIVFQQNTKASLTKIFTEFENTHKIYFSYANVVSDSISINLITKKITLIQLQKWILKNTLYQLKTTDNKNFILSKRLSKTAVISTFIVDSESQFSVVNAKIINLSSKQKTLSDLNGEFSITISSLKDSLIISHPLYNNFKATAEIISNKKIQLIPKAELLNEIVVKNYVTQGIDKNNDGSISLTNNNLSFLPGVIEQDVLENLQTLPGVSSPSENNSLLNIRGGSSDQNLVLWDGIKIYNTGHFFNEISAINPFIVEKTQFYKSGTSALYGDRIGGIINITSLSNIPKKTSYGAGSNLTTVNASIHTKINDKLIVLAAARRSNTDLINTIVNRNINNKSFQNSRLKDFSVKKNKDDVKRIFFTDFNTKITYNFSPKHQLFFSGIGIKNSLKNKPESSPVIIDDYKLSNYGLSLTSKNQFNTRLSLTTKFYWSDYSFFYKNQVNEEFKIIKENSVVDIGFNSDFHYQINPKNKLITSYQFTNNNVGAKNFEDYDDDFLDESIILINNLNNHTIVNEWQHNTPLFRWHAGYRLSAISGIEKTFFEPRLFTSVKLSNSSRISASAEVKNQILYQFYDTNEDENLEIGNQLWFTAGTIADVITLPTLRNRQVTFGYLYKYKNFKIDFEAYYNHITGISSVNLGFQSLNDTNFLTGNENRQGIDLLIHQRIKNYQFWLSYGFNTTTTQFPELSQKRFSGNFEQKHSIRLSQTYLWNDYNFGFSWQWATGTPYSTPIDVHKEGILKYDFENLNSERLKNFQRIDISVARKFQFKKSKIIAGASVKNLLNTKNILTRRYSTVENNDGTYTIKSADRLSLKFTPNAFLRVEF